MTAWVRSSFCAGGDCTEVARATDGSAVWVRHSKDGPVLRFTTAEWDAFVAGVKAGNFDNLQETP